MHHIEIAESEKESVYLWLRDYNHERNGDFMRSLEIEGTEIPLFLTVRNGRFHHRLLSGCASLRDSSLVTGAAALLVSAEVDV